ncbi:MAG: TlpA disulfide reductase family protein [Bacteroidetes bacterium]|nr:TlpA disulfide reductase family protein [Bacteroidota bacterium]
MLKILAFLFLIISNNLEAQKIAKVKIKDLLQIIDTSTNPTVLNFWASWCKPCIEEIPYFEKEAENNKSKNLKLILVNLDFPEDYPKHIQNFVKKEKYKSKIIWLDETDADYFCPLIDSSWNGAIPVTIMINNKKNYRKFYNSKISPENLKIAFRDLTDD